MLGNLFFGISESFMRNPATDDPISAYDYDLLPENWSI